MKNFFETGIYLELDSESYHKIIQLNTTHLRNLAWYLVSSPLVFSGINISVEKTSVNWLFRDWDWFEYQNKNPDRIGRYIQEHKKNKRLGFYAETLLQYWFESNENFKLIEAGTQIQREGKTITEIDFFFQDLITGQYYFWETTLKFYLFDDQSEEWIGPGGKDKAKLKLKKVIDLQLPEGKTFLNKKYDTDFSTQLFVKGRLFHASHPVMKWQHYSSLWSNGSDLKKPACFIPKSDWMFANSIFNNNHKSLELLKPQLDREMKEKGKALVYIEGDYFPYFTFLVEDGWPHLSH